MQLRHGPLARDSAIQLACELEARGFVLSEARGMLTCSNGSALTADDRAAIVANRAHLIALVDYCRERPYERT